MTLRSRTPASPCRPDPSADTRAWRRGRLLEAGFPASVADDAAADPALDLLALLQLVDRGCPPRLAVRIVTPAEGEGEG